VKDPEFVIVATEQVSFSLDLGINQEESKRKYILFDLNPTATNEMDCK
jgi:hypothetical protein